MEKRICRASGKEFIISDEDIVFYNKINVPFPTLCPEERQRRKYLWRNERTLYRRTCDKTGKSIVSMYAPDNRFPVYDIKEWWSDSWDAKDYAQEIDFTRSFFEQFTELQNKVPRLALLNKNTINSDYSNHTNNSKDAFMCATAFDSENVLYSTNVIPLKNGLDCYNIQGKANEYVYESMDVHNGYNCQYCYRVDSSFDCYYSFDLRNCSNCFLSYNLRGQSYYFRNQKYSKEEYFEKIKEFNLSSYQDRQKLYTEWKDIIFKKALQKGVIIESSVSSTGNDIYNSKNIINCFNSEDVEDSKNIIYTTHKIKDCYDSYHVGVNCELLYENHAIVRSANVGDMLVNLYDNTNLTYCDSCHNSNELFGCVGVKKGSYMILNKQYPKEEYFELKEKLIQHMKDIGEYGEFFPPDLSPFAYNETQAQVYMPLREEEVREHGLVWKTDMPGTYGKETIYPENIPDNIEDVPDSITTEVLKCIVSGRNYNVVPQELDLYKRLKIPIPRIHPDERYKNRILLRPDRQLYKTNCFLCNQIIDTAYPENRRPLKIVCEECYKQEVL